MCKIIIAVACLSHYPSHQPCNRQVRSPFCTKSGIYFGICLPSIQEQPRTHTASSLPLRELFIANAFISVRGSLLGCSSSMPHEEVSPFLCMTRQTHICPVLHEADSHHMLHKTDTLCLHCELHHVSLPPCGSRLCILYVCVCSVMRPFSMHHFPPRSWLLSPRCSYHLCS